MDDQIIGEGSVFLQNYSSEYMQMKWNEMVESEHHYFTTPSELVNQGIEHHGW